MKKLLTLALLLGGGVAQAAEIHFQQNLDNSLWGLNSQIGSQEIADNFMLDVDADVNYLEWYGSYHHYVSNQSITDVFSVRVMEEAAGSENTFNLLHEFHVSAAGTDTGLVDAWRGNTVFHFKAELPVFSVEANSELWLSISQEIYTEENIFMWSTSSDGENAIANYTGEFSPIRYDDRGNSAFALGSIVPIPAAVYLFASGLSLLGWFRRDKWGQRNKWGQSKNLVIGLET